MKANKEVSFQQRLYGDQNVYKLPHLNYCSIWLQEKKQNTNRNSENILYIRPLIYIC